MRLAASDHGGEKPKTSPGPREPANQGPQTSFGRKGLGLQGCLQDGPKLSVKAASLCWHVAAKRDPDLCCQPWIELAPTSWKNSIRLGVSDMNFGDCRHTRLVFNLSWSTRHPEIQSGPNQHDIGTSGSPNHEFRRLLRALVKDGRAPRGTLKPSTSNIEIASVQNSLTKKPPDTPPQPKRKAT